MKEEKKKVVVERTVGAFYLSSVVNIPCVTEKAGRSELQFMRERARKGIFSSNPAAESLKVSSFLVFLFHSSFFTQ
jgi:hypothetical protein